MFPIADQKFSRYFDVYLQFFAVLQNSYVFIPLFLREPKPTFCGTLRFRRTLFEKQ